MDVIVKNSRPPGKSFSAFIFHPIINVWNRLINIGIDENTSQFDKKRTRLINGICSWAVSIFLVYVFVYANNKSAKIIFYNSLAGVICNIIPIVINYYHKYNIACHIVSLFYLLLNLFMAIVSDGHSGVEYIFVPSSVTAMLFFKDARVVFFYFLANFLFFGLSKLSFTSIHPGYVYEDRKYLYMANHITMFVILFMIINYFKSENARQEKLLESKNISLSDEKQKSDNLLLNILPHETAEELKQTGTAKSRSFNMVTTMFTDFKNFTHASEILDPEKLVSELHYYFSKFDEIVKKHNLEKIKTIGDSYMCAGGIPHENNSHSFDVVMAALEIQEFMHLKKLEKQNTNELFFELRLGIHSGPVIAGIVGTNKFAYDIWGDTVNIASRMESSGQVGKVNISGITYELIKDRFRCDYRGKIAVKNKGEIDMYFVEGRNYS